MVDEPSTLAETVELAKTLKAARAAKGLTLRQVAAQTGISNGYLSLIEQGDVRSPAPRYLFALAERYELPFDLLMALAGHPSGPSAVRSSDSQVSPVASREANGDSGDAGEPSSLGSRAMDSSRAGAHQPAVSEPPPARDGTKGDGALPTASERQQLTDLVLDDMRVLSTADIAQVRAFIAGLRAARRA